MLWYMGFFIGLYAVFRSQVVFDWQADHTLHLTGFSTSGGPCPTLSGD